MVNFLLKQGANVNAKTKVKNFSLLAFAFYYEPVNQALQTHTIGAFSLGNYIYCMISVNIWWFVAVVEYLLSIISHCVVFTKEKSSSSMSVWKKETENLFHFIFSFYLQTNKCELISRLICTWFTPVSYQCAAKLVTKNADTDTLRGMPGSLQSAGRRVGRICCWSKRGWNDFGRGSSCGGGMQFIEERFGDFLRGIGVQCYWLVLLKWTWLPIAKTWMKSTDFSNFF